MGVVGVLKVGPQPRKVTISRVPYEKYIYVYLFFVVLSLALNYSGIRKQALAAVPLEIVTFLVVHSVAKKYVTESVFDAIIKAILIMATVSAVISFIQIAVSSEFLKTCEPRIAFGSVVRASATFQAEYELGYFQILAVMIATVRFKGLFLRYLLTSLFTASLLLTFHRLDLIILLVCFIAYVLIFGKTRQKVIQIGALVFGLVLVALSFQMLDSFIGDSAFVKERVEEDTLSGRLEQYKTIVFALRSHVFYGVGDYSSDQYYALMEQSHQLYTEDAGTYNWHRVAYDVHNGFLAAGIYYGATAMVIFSALLVSMLKYFKRKISKEFRYSIVPFFAVLIWTLANTTNGVSRFGMYFILLIAMLCGSSIALQRSAERKLRRLDNAVLPGPK